MRWFRRRPQYDRARILDAAARARARKRRHKAIELYRWVLALEPQNGEIHARLAPLLAETGQRFDAWCSYKAVARACMRSGHADQALAVYREACVRLPREAQTWQAAARLLAKRGQNREAIETLLEGSRRFRSPRLRPQAIHLLRRARELDPWDFQLVFELARLLRRSGQRPESSLLLDGLAQRCGGERLRRVRGAQLRLAPGLGSAWRWLHAALRPAAEPRGGSAGQAGRAGVVPLRIAPRR
jgi:tetratricopeptide (TPR) repeat protein